MADRQPRLTKTGAAERFTAAAELARRAHANGESMSVALQRAGFASTVRSAQQLIVTLRKKGHKIPNGLRKIKPAPVPPPPPPPPPPAPKPLPPPVAKLPPGERSHVLACTEEGCDAEFDITRGFDMRQHTLLAHGRRPTLDERTPVVVPAPPVRVRVYEDDAGYTAFTDDIESHDDFIILVPAAAWATWTEAQDAAQEAHDTLVHQLGLDTHGGIARTPCDSYTGTTHEFDGLLFDLPCRRCNRSKMEHPQPATDEGASA